MTPPVWVSIVFVWTLGFMAAIGVAIEVYCMTGAALTRAILWPLWLLLTLIREVRKM